MKCKDCGIELELGKNWTVKRKQNHNYLCKDCNNNRINKWREENREKYLESHRRRQKKYQNKIRGEIKMKLGSKCFICGFEPKNRRLSAHEIHGKKHTETPAYILEHIENFVPLCRKCHDSVHFCMDFLGLSWEDIMGMRKNVLDME